MDDRSTRRDRVSTQRGVADPPATDVDRSLAVTIAIRVRTARENAGLSQADLARLAAVAPATLSALESGGANPTVQTLSAIARALGCRLGDLLGDDPDPMDVVVRADVGIWRQHLGTEARPIHRFTPHGPVEALMGRWPAGQFRESSPHEFGVYEHVLVVRGSLTVGTHDRFTDLGEGDYVCFPAWFPHSYRTAQAEACAFILLSYTRALSFGHTLAHGPS